MTKETTLFNHIESTTSGDMYRRAKEMRLLNPKNGTKAVEYYQEDWVNLLNGTGIGTVAPTIRLDITVDKLGLMLDLVDPNTGEILGKKSLLEMVQTTFLFSHSLYIFTENETNKANQLLATQTTSSTPPVVTPVSTGVVVTPTIQENTLNTETVSQNNSSNVQTTTSEGTTATTVTNGSIETDTGSASIESTTGSGSIGD